MHISSTILASLLSLTAVSTALPWGGEAESYDSSLYARDAYPEPELESHELFVRDLVNLRRDLHAEFRERDLEIRSAIEELFERDANPAQVTWKDPNALKNNPTEHARQTQLASDALDRAGCAAGTVCSSGFHKSPPGPGSDQKNHITVDKGSGKHPVMHVYEDGTASRKSNKGKTVNFRRGLDYEY
ncbi:hypothetical protein MMC34_007518 [Xylographa carneopallida]|nr:hypothetical protein [Xylographa carneopallida]